MGDSLGDDYERSTPASSHDNLMPARLPSPAAPEAGREEDSDDMGTA